MTYKRKREPSQEGKVILVKSEIGKTVIVVVLLLCGAIPCLFGTLGLVMGDVSKGTLILAGFGWAFVGAGLLFASVSNPPRLVFDNQRGVLRIEETPRDKKRKEPVEAVLPYNEMEGFGVALRSNPGSRGRFYTVELLKKDGAFWGLASFSSKAPADAMCEDLCKDVALGTASEESEPPKVSDLFKESESPERSRIEWQEPPDRWKKGMALWTVAGFALIVIGTRKEMPFLIFGLLVVVFGLLVVALVKDVLAPKGALSWVEVGATDLRVRSARRLFGAKEQTIPLEEVEAILFQFSENAYGIQSLLFLKKREKEIQRKMREAPGEVTLQDVWELQTQAARLDAASLSVGEVLYLEQRLQGWVEARTGRRPL